MHQCEVISRQPGRSHEVKFKISQKVVSWRIQPQIIPVVRVHYRRPMKGQRMSNTGDCSTCFNFHWIIFSRVKTRPVHPPRQQLVNGLSQDRTRNLKIHEWFCHSTTIREQMLLINSRFHVLPSDGIHTWGISNVLKKRLITVRIDPKVSHSEDNFFNCLTTTGSLEWKWTCVHELVNANYLNY